MATITPMTVAQVDKEGKSAYWMAQELGYQRICEALYPGAGE